MTKRFPRLTAAALALTLVAAPALAGQPGADWMPMDQVLRKLADAGYGAVQKIEADDGQWEGKAHQGRQGRVVHGRPEERCRDREGQGREGGQGRRQGRLIPRRQGPSRRWPLLSVQFIITGCHVPGRPPLPRHRPRGVRPGVPERPCDVPGLERPHSRAFPNDASASPRTCPSLIPDAPTTSRSHPKSCASP